MGELFFEITVIVCVASILTIIFNYLKQPPILAFILTGIIFGPFNIFNLENRQALTTFGEFGITFLLFMLGLELKFEQLKSVGKIALITGLSQIVFTSLIGFALCTLLGFSVIISWYIAIALTFSSTIIVVKLLSEKKDTTALYGKISLGILIAQDFAAILILIFLSTFVTSSANPFSYTFFLQAIIKAIFLFLTVIVISRAILPRLIDEISESSETLFLFSIALAFGLAAFVSSPLIGFSIEIGGFLAGIALANSSENFQIAAHIKPLRDFFITIFFVLLGMSMTLGNFFDVLFPAILLSVFVIVGKPLIVMIILGVLGYRKRTSFLSGLTIAQISEFSLILIFLGQKIGHIKDSNIITLITIVGLATFLSSTYMILYTNALYKFFKPYLGNFERKGHHTDDTDEVEKFDGHILLIGANRTGQSIIEAIKDEKHKIVVADFDPDVITELKKIGIPAIFGDITDPEIEEKLSLEKAKIVISTVQDIKDNLYLIKAFRKKQNDGQLIVLAHDKKDAQILYENGANFVVIPHLSGGLHIASILKSDHINLKREYEFKA